MSCAVPIGPLMPRSGYRSSSSSMRSTATRISSAAEAKRLPRVVACAATLWERPAMTRDLYSPARLPTAFSSAIALSRVSSRARRTCSCSTFSVRSREVIPLWISSWPASALNSSMRAFTSWRVIFSREAMDSRSTWSMTFS